MNTVEIQKYDIKNIIMNNIKELEKKDNRNKK